MKKYRIISMLLLLILCISFIKLDVEATELVMTENEVISDKLTVDLDEDVEIHVELDNKKSMMGVSVYQVGVYTDDGFSYIEPYRSLVSRDYYEANTKKELAKQINTISEYIIDNNLTEDGRIKVVNGSGKSNELSVGLYLLIQNKDSANATMDEVQLVEAPTYSDENDEYMYELHIYPKWEKSVWFSFRPEVVYPLALISALIICAFLVFAGSKMFRSLIISAVALFTGLVGFQLGIKYTDSYLWSMVFFVLFAYATVLILYPIFHLFKINRKRSKETSITGWILSIVTPLIGSVVSAGLIYFFLSKNLWFMLIPAIAGVLGIVLQIITMKKHKIFYTYDDLIGDDIKSSNKIRFWFWINILFSVLYLFWRIFFTIPLGYGIVSNLAGIILLIVEALGLAEAIVHYSNMNNAREYVKPDIAPELFPDVDVFIATYTEDAELLTKTILGCKRMDYPDKNKVHIYLCDDGHREEIKELANKLGVNYLDREDHYGQKAGNLNNALKHSSSPYVVTLDSDMIPQSSFLMETIPYFVDAEIRNQSREEGDKIKLGFLQTPQSFYDLDLFQFNLHSEGKIPNEQDYFYRDIEVARTRTNSCIYGGSNTILSREALEAIGGFYTEAITEDFATGILIQKAGFVSLAIPKRLASGVSAKTLRDLVQQRVRWARGVISTGRKVHIYTSKDLSFGQKINYWASIWYWYAPIKRFCYVMSPILYATFGFMVFRCTFWQVLLFWLPMYFTSNMNLKTLSNNIRNTKWTAIYEYALFPYMLIPVLLETIGISLKKFKVTSKNVIEEEKDSYFAFKIPIFFIVVLSIIGVLRGIFIIFESGSLGPAVVLFWLIYNLYSMIMCLFFVDGRKRYRSTERVYAKVDGLLHVNDKFYSCFTRDMSENGIAIYLEKPILIENSENTDVYLRLSNGKWDTKLWLEIKHTDRDKDGKWLYTFAITDYDSFENYDNYLALLYDRVPTNPSFIKKSNGVYDDLTTNISRRVSVATYLKRQYPRIIMNCPVKIIINGEEKEIKVIDFNYQYFRTASECGMTKDENGNDVVIRNVTFVLGDYKIETEFERKLEHSCLYKVVEFNKIYFDEEKRDEIMELILQIIEKAKEKTEIKNG